MALVTAAVAAAARRRGLWCVAQAPPGGPAPPRDVRQTPSRPVTTSAATTGATVAPPSTKVDTTPNGGSSAVTVTPKTSFGPITSTVLADQQTALTSLLKEYAYWVQDSWVTGTIPKELHGTYYRNGPGLHVSNPRYKRHHFDGDGMVLSLAFREGRAYWRNRFVRTKGFVEEQAAGRPLYRNVFTRGAADGAPFFNPFDLQFKNVANTGVMRWAGQLYALWEAGLPYQLDPVTLDTLGESTLGGQLAASTLGAHYRVTTERQADGSTARRFVGFSVDASFGGATATFYEFDEQGRKIHQTRHPLEGVTMALVHDLFVTEHYYGLVLGPVDLSAHRFATEYLFSRCSIAECLEYNPGGRTRVVLVPRPGRDSGRKLRVRELPADPSFVFHHVNAYEAEYPPSDSGTAGPYDEPLVVLDTLRLDTVSFTVRKDTYTTPEYYKGGQRTHLYRHVCDLRSGAVSETRLLRRTGEFPATDPRVVGRPHRATWLGCDMVDDALMWGSLQGIARVQLDPTYGLPAGARVGDLVAPGTPAHHSNRNAALASIRTHTGRPRVSGRNMGSSSPPAATAAFMDSSTAPGVRLDVWSPGPRCFVGEPMFVPRPGSTAEGDGWLLVPTHNAESMKGEVHILEANSLERGPVATIRLPHVLPVGLHGTWDNAYTGPDPRDIGVPQWQELGTIRPM